MCPSVVKAVMKHFKNIVATLVFVLMWVAIAFANGPRPKTDGKTAPVYAANLDAGMVHYNSGTLNASDKRMSFLLYTETVPAIQQTLSSSNSLSDHFFIRPHTRKEFRIVRFLDNSLQIGLTKLIIAI